MFYNNNTIEAIHFEITDRCNASCPQCIRNIFGGKENPYLPNAEVDLERFKTMITTEVISNLKRFYMCGNFGDPIAARDTLKIFSHLRNINPNLHLAMNTNASLRDAKWWSSLAEIFESKGNVKFGIDGLSDTHSLYRIGTDFNTVINNAKSFIKSGGEAIWEFLVFKHNEHQVDQARELSKELGFKEFRLKKTGRFFSNNTDEVATKQKVLDKNGDIKYYLEMPSSVSLRNSSIEKESTLIEKFGDMRSYFDETEISCKVEKEKSIYISSEGLAFPCCWTAMQVYSWYENPYENQMVKLIEDYGGKAKIDTRLYSLEEITKGPLFLAIKNSWSACSLSEGKLRVCAKTCGTLFDQFKDQYN